MIAPDRAGLVDLDNDGQLEIFFVNGNVYPEVEQHFEDYHYKCPRVVLLGRGGGKFEDVSLRCGPGISARHSSRGCAFGDFDNDGDIDVIVWNMNEPDWIRSSHNIRCFHGRMNEADVYANHGESSRCPLPKE